MAEVITNERKKQIIMKALIAWSALAILACCLSSNGQSTATGKKDVAAKQPSPSAPSPGDWRKAEEKFAKFIGMPELTEKLDKPDAPPPAGLRGYSFVPKVAGTPIADIQKSCGAPSRVVTDRNTKQKIFFYGRVGYTTKDGKTLDQLTIVVSISGVDEYEK